MLRTFIISLNALGSPKKKKKTIPEIRVLHAHGVPNTHTPDTNTCAYRTVIALVTAKEGGRERERERACSRRKSIFVCPK